MNFRKYLNLAEKVKTEVDNSFQRKNGYFLVTDYAHTYGEEEENTLTINYLVNSVNVANHYPSTVRYSSTSLEELQKKQVLFTVVDTSLDVKYCTNKPSIKLDIKIKLNATQITQKVNVKIHKDLTVEENTHTILRDLVELLIVV